MARKDFLLKMRDTLIQRRDALRRALAGDLSVLTPLTNQSDDDALDAAQDEISAKLAEVEQQEIANIDAALERMRSGTYGRCEDCRGTIPLGRLNAVPFATTCIECQRAREANSGFAVDWSEALGGDEIPLDLLELNEPIAHGSPRTSPSTSEAEIERAPAKPPLIITRRKNESIVLNDDVTIVVVEVRGDKVRLGVEVPHGWTVQRGEVYEAIRRNRESGR